MKKGSGRSLFHQRPFPGSDKCQADPFSASPTPIAPPPPTPHLSKIRFLNFLWTVSGPGAFPSCFLPVRSCTSDAGDGFWDSLEGSS